ncbi:hypothetical protein ACH4FV_36985 [Streptomyces anulatus]
MSTKREPAGDEPEEQPEPEQSGAEPIQHNRPESVTVSFVRGMAEGAGRVVGTALASAVIIGLTAGGVITVTEGGPHLIGGASSTA